MSKHGIIKQKVLVVQLMKYSIPKNHKCEFDTDNMLFFAHRIEEMLFDYTSGLYKMPLLNTHGLIIEYLNVDKKMKKGEVKEYQREIVYEELLETLKNDIVLSENWGKENIKTVIDSLGSCGKEKIPQTINYLNAILEKNYYAWCRKSIIKYLEKPKEKVKMEAVIRCFLPEIVYFGYEPEFIYSMLKVNLFQKSNFDSASIKEFLGIFNRTVYDYNVYFSISNVSLKFREILQKRLRFNFEDDGNFKHFKVDSDKVIIRIDNIKALCPNGAVKSAYKLVDLFFGFYKYIGNKKRFSIQDTAMVIVAGEKPVFIRPQKIYYNIVDSLDFKGIGERSEKLITGLLINAASEYGLLKKSIELHNTALAIPDLKSGFLNLWSSIEVLCQNNDADSKIYNVLKIVVPILKKDYLKEIVEDIYKNIEENLDKKELNKILDKVEDKGCVEKKVFSVIWLEKYKDLRNELISKLYDYPVIRYRISQISNLSSTKHLNEFVKRYEKRVTWHLYRMYRTRNSIIHSGEIPDNIKHLGEHLHSYVDSTVNEFVIKLSGPIPFSSVNDIIVDINYASSNFNKMLESNLPINEDIIKTIMHPELGHTMNCERHQA